MASLNNCKVTDTTPNEPRTQYAEVLTPREETLGHTDGQVAALDVNDDTAAPDSADKASADGVDGDKKPSATPGVPFKELYRFATPMDKVLVGVGVLMAGVNGALFPCMALVFGNAISAFGQVGQAVDKDAVNAAALDFFLIAIALFVTDYASFVLFSYTAERQVKAMRDQALKHMLYLDIGWYDSTNALMLSSRLTGDTVVIKNGMGQKLGEACKYTCQFIAGYAIGFAKGWDMTLLMFCIMPVMAVSLGFVIRVMRARSEISQKMYAKAGAIAEETLGSMRTVASLNGENRAIDKYNAQALLAETENITVAKYWATMIGVFMACVWVMYAVGLWYGGSKVADDKASPSEVFQVFFGVLLGTLSVSQVGPNLGAIAQARGAAAALYDILDTPSKIDASKDDGIVPDSCSGHIHVSDVSFAYPTRPDASVLNHYNLVIESGQTVAFVGSSGSGKSTLVSLLERFYDPTSGAIFLDGRDITTLNLAWLRSQIGLVSQEPVLFADTIAANIAGVDGDGNIVVSREQIVAAAKLANAHAFIMSLPLNYETLVGEKGVSLSGGQKQRVAIARAVVRNPKVLVLDEATSALDSESEREVQAALDDLVAKTHMTTLVIAHRLSTVRHADKIVVVSGGSVVEEGPHATLVALDHGVYRHLYTIQQTRAQEEDEAAVGRASQADVLVQNPTRLMRKTSSRKAIQSVDGLDYADAADESLTPTKRFTIADAMAFSRPERGYFVVGILTSAVNGFAFPLSAVLVSEIVASMTRYYTAFQRTRDRAYLDSLADAILIDGLCYLGGAVVVFFVTAVQNYCFKYMAEKLTSRLRAVQFAALCRQNIAFFDETQHATGALTAALSTHATSVALLSGDSQGRVVQAGFTFVAAITISFSTGSWALTLVLLGVFPLLVFGQFVRMRNMNKTADGHSADELTDAGAHASEALGNVRTVAAFGMEKRLAHQFAALLEAPMHKGHREAHGNGLSLGLASFAMFAAYALAFWYGGVLVDRGAIDFKQMMRTMMAMMMSAQGVGSAVSLLADADNALKAGAAIAAIRDREPPIDAFSEDGRRPAGVEGKIEFRDVTFRYPTRTAVTVLKDFNLTIQAGETVALCGSSGGGKSTCLSLLERFYDPECGDVSLDGYSLKTLNLHWLRSHIGVVSQEPTLFTGSIADNIAYGLVSSRADVEAAAKMANAHDFISHFPDGYDTQVGAKGEQLSGGQKQRVAIARAILRDPDILLLDEATSALDSESEKLVQEALDTLVALKRRTTIIVAHRLSTIRKADKICVISGGCVAEEGTHSELLARNGNYARLVQHAIN